MLDQKLTDLFRMGNHKFSTLEKGGERRSSLYFQDINGNQGRWRREHPNGELLVYQGKSLRVFIEPDKVDDYIGVLEDRPTIAKKIWMDLRDAIPDGGYSAKPMQGWHVIELVPPVYFQGHASSGTVLLNDHTAGNADYAELANYTGNISDWTQAPQ